MFSLAEIRSWPTARIYEELKDQKAWMRESRGSGMSMTNANEYLYRLYRVLDERKVGG